VTSGKSSHSREFREKVALEAIESENIRATASKYELKPTTVYGWVKVFKNKDILKRNKTLSQMQKDLDEKDLEIRILKELLKKTTLTLIKD
jgi:transposase-like protein